MAEVVEVLCTWCRTAVDPERDDHIQAECSVEACGSRPYHVECIQEFFRSGRVDTRTSNTSAALAMKAKIQNTPQEVMKRRPCPVGRDKASSTEEIEPCCGMVIHASYHAHKKPKKKTTAQSMPSAHLFTKQKDKFAKQQPASRKDNAKDSQSRQLLNLHLHHQDAAGSSNGFAVLHEDGMRGNLRRGKKLKVLLAEHAKWSQEQIDFAIKEGRLTPEFRTRLCSSITGEEPCRLGSQCHNAHSPAELRVEAAVERGYLPHDYKTAFCETFLQSGQCEDGIECMKAHDWGELRVRAAIQMGVLDMAFKTEMCPAYEASQECQQGEFCTHAHGRKQLRAEAAVQLSKVAADYKTSLCDMWCLAASCAYGCLCLAAHGVLDMRIQAAINAGTVMDVYKTQRCLKANCKRLHCTYYHDESDQLPLSGYKAQYCVAYKETGACPYGTECHFAHDSSELVNVDTSANFVTRTIESEDTESMISTDTTESKDIRSTTRDARAGGAVVPLAVSSGKMPLAPPKAAVKQRRRKGGAELRLCKKFQDTGNCTDPNCRLAHGADDLKKRQEDAMGQNRPPMPTFKAADVPAPRVFSATVMEAIQTFVLSACVEHLTTMGFSFDKASRAARIAAGNAAVELLMSGHVSDAGIPEMTVQAEVDDLCCIANTLNINTAEIEAAVLKHYGNHREALKELQAREITNGIPGVSPQKPEGIQSSKSQALADSTFPEADSDADGFAATERHLWAGVRRPTWEAESQESFVPSNPSTTYLPEQRALEETPVSQTATEETTWQEYRPEDFGIGVAARQPGQEEDDELLHAAIQASKAQVLAEEACFKFVEGKDLHAVAADKSGNGPALNSIPQHAASHRAWFPPADTFVSEACPGGPTGQDAEQQEVSSGTQEQGSKDTYTDVMAYLLGS